MQRAAPACNLGSTSPLPSRPAVPDQMRNLPCLHADAGQEAPAQGRPLSAIPTPEGRLWPAYIAIQTGSGELRVYELPEQPSLLLSVAGKSTDVTVAP